MLTIEEALRRILDTCRTLPAADVSLADAAGQVLAEHVVSTADSPPFDKSMMDGYAVRMADVPEVDIVLQVVGEISAGSPAAFEVVAGTAVRIMTGAPIPPGADAVVRFEDTAEAAEGRVKITAGPLRRGMNITPRGAMFHRGEPILDSGRRLRPQELALLAEVGRDIVRVHRRPSVAVLATGDELVPPGQPPGPGQICNSNETMLVGQMRRWGCRAVGLGIARDNREELRDKISQGLARDVLILTGGVSMGTLDLVPQVLPELGVEQVFHKVQLKPGKPLWFGVRRVRAAPGASHAIIFALPGNPVSSMVCSELFVRPAVRKLAGLTAAENPVLSARLTQAHDFRDDRPTCFPAWIEFRDGGTFVTPAPWKGSADVRGTLRSNGIILFPAGQKHYEPGEPVSVMPWFFED